MVELQTNETIDICCLSKIILKENVNATVDEKSIKLSGEISEDLLNNIEEQNKISKFQNFASEPISEKTKVDEEKFDEKNVMENPVIKQEEKVLDLRYPEVKYGEVYLCDFGSEFFGYEIGKERYAIIVQSDIVTLNSQTTIVVPCTTTNKVPVSYQYHFFFSEQNMVDYENSHVSPKMNVALADQVRTIDKTRLRFYLGTMNAEFMEKMQVILGNAFNLQIKSNKANQFELNYVQLKMLEFVKIKDFKETVESTKFSDEAKVQEILKLFGFDMKKKGVNYLCEAILISQNNDHFTFENLSELIKADENIDKNEKMRLMIARIKETFKLKKTPALEFIKLVKLFMSKKEENNYEESDI